MSLFDLPHFSAFVAAQPGTGMVEQWESHVAKVGGKVFALLGGAGQSICFKVEEVSFDGLCSVAGVTQAPYFARRQWVNVARGSDLTDAEIEAYLMRSYHLVAAKLTRKLRAEIGIALPSEG